MEALSTTTATVWLPPALIDHTGRRRTVKVAGETIREVIEGLERSYPGISFHICYETGELREFVNVFLNGEEIRYLSGLDTPVSPGAIIHIIHSVAGG